MLTSFKRSTTRPVEDPTENHEPMRQLLKEALYGILQENTYRMTIQNDFYVVEFESVQESELASISKALENNDLRPVSRKLLSGAIYDTFSWVGSDKLLQVAYKPFIRPRL